MVFSSWLPKIFEENGMPPSQAGFAASIPIASGIPALLFIPSLIPPRFIGRMIMGAAGGMFFCVAEIGGFSGPALMVILVDVTGNFMAGTIFLAVLCTGVAILTYYTKAER